MQIHYSAEIEKSSSNSKDKRTDSDQCGTTCVIVPLKGWHLFFNIQEMDDGKDDLADASHEVEL